MPEESPMLNNSISRILVVDDDPRIRNLLRAWLELAGYDVNEAADGQKAIKTFRPHPPDLVICDMFMAGMDGIETIRVLQRAYPEVKIIAMSGGGFDGKLDLLSMAKYLGATVTLAKPLEMSDVLTAIKQVLSAGPAD